MGENGKKKWVFLPFFMFIGVGIGFLLLDQFGGLAVIVCTFLGLGLGFFLDSIVTVERKEIRAELPARVGGVIYCAVGVIFIVSGILTMISPELLVNYVTYLMGLGFIIVGAYILVFGFKLAKPTSW